MTDERFNNLVHALQDGVAVTSKELGDEIFRIYAELSRLREEVAMYKERWELEQNRYEGISGANDGLRARLALLEKVAEAADEFCDPRRCGINTVIRLRAALQSAKSGKEEG